MRLDGLFRVVVELEREAERVCARVLGSVVQRFLGDPVQRLLCRLGQIVVRRPAGWSQTIEAQAAAGSTPGRGRSADDRGHSHHFGRRPRGGLSSRAHQRTLLNRGKTSLKKRCRLSVRGKSRKFSCM